MEKEKINYNIGIDIGTKSVGWAVTDENFNLLKKGNKNMWGSRLFDSAEVAAGRRVSRSIRRRYNKRRERIRLLREIMSDVVLEKDPIFFIRLNETTFLDDEDKLFFLGKNYKGNYNLFDEDDYNDQTYFEKFPTIYHLRNHLCISNRKEDPRLIYLALHHIVKYRGNFLYENQNFSLDNSNKVDDIKNIFSKLSEYNDFDLIIENKIIEEILDIFKEKVSRKQKIDKCLKLLPVSKENKNSFTNLIAGLVGNQFNFSKIITVENVKSNDSDIKLKFTDIGYEAKLDEYSGDLGDYIEFIGEMQRMYSWVELNGIVSSEDEELSISKSMIKRYKEHKKDLKYLKILVKEYDQKIYNDLFRSKDIKLHNYYNYIHNPAKTKREDFYKYLTKILNEIGNEKAKYCLEKIENEDFLLKQNDTSNGEIPYQLNLHEMEQILEQQSKYYDCLKENKEKIIKILTFRIPYYYGPLDGNKEFGWLKKRDGKEKERILPWNHEEVVDVEKTATDFIVKLTNFCTYLSDEPVMPKKSLTCSMYEVLAELNKIRVDGKLISRDIKERIIKELFMQRKTIKDLDLKKWWKKNQLSLNNEDLIIEGYQKEKAFSTSLAPWIDFTNILGEITNDNYEMIENIIKDITIFNEGKIIKTRLKKLYDLSDAQIKKILKLNYTGWSRLSKKLILGITTARNDSSTATILDIMKETNMALMEIINSDKYDFKEIIDDANTNLSSNRFNIEDVNKLAGSPALKKGIWQSLQIIEEITKFMKHRPKNIYIEFAREEGEKKRTSSRVKRLQNIYKELLFQSEEERKVRTQLDKENSSFRLDNDRLYLYYLQMGKCMYSGESLNIDMLSTYEIDHIIPRSLIKDESIDNKVLVIKDKNQRKANDLVILDKDRDNQADFWKRLYDSKLISQKKYYNLMRTEINETQQEKFINRQLVETRQIIKHVANMIKNNYEDTKVVAIRTNLISGFREKYNIYKNRNINDYHHAHDAYIACIMGQYITKRFPKLNDKYEYGKYLEQFNKIKSKKNEKKDNHLFVLKSMAEVSYNGDTGEVIWNPENIGKIIRCFYYRDCFITKKLESNDSALFKVTILPNAKNSPNGKTLAKIPVNKKRQNVDKYGGFTNLEYSIYAIEGNKNDKSSKLVRKLVGMPLIYQDSDEQVKIDYIENNENLKNVKLIKEFKKNQLIEIDGGLFYLSSAKEIVNAKQLLLSTNKLKINANKLVYEINKALKKNEYDNLNSDDIDSLYGLLIEKIDKLYPKYGGIVRKLQEAGDKFKELPLKDKAFVIDQILKITSSGAQNGTIKLNNFNLGDRMGRLGGQTIYLDDTYFFDQSITGLYSKKYKL